MALSLRAPSTFANRTAGEPIALSPRQARGSVPSETFPARPSATA